MSEHITIISVNVGDIIGDMHMHQVNTGVFKDWEVRSKFEINRDQFDALLAKSQTHGELIQNKMARAVSSSEGADGSVDSILIIYSYDHSYWCATILRP